MRDPERIDPAIERLRAAWKSDPDIRLGQLIYNAARANRRLDPLPELFYMEDEELLGGLDFYQEEDRG